MFSLKEISVTGLLVLDKKDFRCRKGSQACVHLIVMFLTTY